MDYRRFLSICLITLVIAPRGLCAQSAITPPIKQARPDGEFDTRERCVASVGCAWFGTRLQRVTDEIADLLAIHPKRGALVAGVEGPTKLAGIEPGDVIVGFDGKDVNDVMDYVSLIREVAVGQQAEFVIIRRGATQTKMVRSGRLYYIPPAIPRKGSIFGEGKTR
jgi:serine protease Do